VLKYEQVSDDGKTFFNGFEKVDYSFTTGSRYEADVEMTGEQQGEMKLRVEFSKITFKLPPRLLFDLAEDGKPKSHGYVKYNGVTLRIEDLVE
jgi:hypothetical protein